MWNAGIPASAALSPTGVQLAAAILPRVNRLDFLPVKPTFFHADQPQGNPHLSPIYIIHTYFFFTELNI